MRSFSLTSSNTCLAFYGLTLLIGSVLTSNNAFAATYSLIIEPSANPSRTQQLYQPLADYLSAQTGNTFEIKTAQNFQTYWQRVKRDVSYDFILDSAHMTDYRIKHHAYVPLVKLLNQANYSLVTVKQNAISDSKKLVGKPVASLSSPSMEYLQLSQLYPNPMRQPLHKESHSASESIQMVMDNKAIAAIIPSDQVDDFPNLTIIINSKDIPQQALSASPNTPKDIRLQVSKALIEATQSTRGKDMLHRSGLNGFEPATVDLYKGYSAMLEGLWGM